MTQVTAQEKGTNTLSQVWVWCVTQFARVGPLPILLLLCFVFFAVTASGFASAENFISIGKQSVFLMLMASAQMLVLVTGGFDMSVGAVVAATSIISSTVLFNMYVENPDQEGIAVFVSLLVALGVGLVIGLLNGLGVTLLRINAFIVTLAMATILEGITLIISGGLEVSGLPPLYKGVIGGGSVAGIPWLIILSVPVIIILLIVMNRTRFGTHLYSLGDNPTAARIAGVNVTRNTIIAYMLASMLVAYSAWLLTARVGSGQPAMGGTYTMESITAAVIGGVSLRGGRGGVFGTVMGVVFIQMLSNGMNLMRLDTNTQSIAVGIALVVAVLIDRLRDQARNFTAARRRLAQAG